MRLVVRDAAGVGLQMNNNDSTHFASNIPRASKYEEFSWETVSYDPSEDGYLDVISLQETGERGPFSNVGLYYNWNASLAETFLTVAQFYNSSNRKTLDVTGIDTLASDAEVFDGSIDFGGWGYWSDTIIGNKYADKLYGYERSDTLRGKGGGDKLGGDSGDDELFGGGGDDTLLGGTGADRLLGNSGSDVLVGGSGDDYLKGGSKADTFVFARSCGSDRIRDFDNGLDHVRIDSGARKFGDLDVIKSGVDTIVEFANVSITFEDTRPGELSSTDFWFGL